MRSMSKELLKFVRQEKKMRLIPLIMVVLAAVALVVFTAGLGIAWTIHPVK